MIDQEALAQEAASHRSFAVTIRTPAGISHKFEVQPQELVEKATDKAVQYFVSHGELAPGDYGLALVRDGVATEMVSSARLEDYGVDEDDILALVAKAPQVDG